MKYDLLVFIGRFQPLHLGHQEVIERALSLSKHVLVLVGSSGQARSARNPFTYLERRDMIKNLYPNVIVKPIHDHTYNDTAWITEVQQVVEQMRKEIFYNLVKEKPGDFEALNKDLKIGLIGCEKDHTSYYLKMFPDWNSEGVEFLNPLNATDIRVEYFEQQLLEYVIAAVVGQKMAKWLTAWKHNNPELFAKQVAEYVYLREYKEEYGAGPFLTADALVQVGGKILLVTRGKEYGHGLLAMPGGFVEKNERFQDAYIRELREETRLRVPIPVLRGSTILGRIFDEPHRSARGRLVTHCYHIRLDNDTSLPEVRGGDDADHADWYDVAWILANEHRFFEDHFFIIRNMLGV